MLFRCATKLPTDFLRFLIYDMMTPQIFFRDVFKMLRKLENLSTSQLAESHGSNLDRKINQFREENCLNLTEEKRIDLLKAIFVALEHRHKLFDHAGDQDDFKKVIALGLELDGYTPHSVSFTGHALQYLATENPRPRELMQRVAKILQEHFHFSHIDKLLEVQELTLQSSNKADLAWKITTKAVNFNEEINKGKSYKKFRLLLAKAVAKDPSYAAAAEGASNFLISKVRDWENKDKYYALVTDVLAEVFSGDLSGLLDCTRSVAARVFDKYDFSKDAKVEALQDELALHALNAWTKRVRALCNTGNDLAVPFYSLEEAIQSLNYPYTRKDASAVAAPTKDFLSIAV